MQEVYIVYSRFNSMVSQTPVAEKLLPIQIETPEESEQAEDYLVEPSAREILADLLP